MTLRADMALAGRADDAPAAPSQVRGALDSVDRPGTQAA
ncbi:hypothetical protein JYK04_07635 [Streptomyces nojiriensis]|nr:hypothetical protein JYK04_07635 [Streptomyces nojiriensis]